MVYSVTGATLATLFLGIFDNGTQELRLALIITGCIGYLGGSFIYFIISRYYPSDLEKDSDMLHEEDSMEPEDQFEA